MNKEVDLSVSCYGKVKDRKYDIVILPWGATEPHIGRKPIIPHVSPKRYRKRQEKSDCKLSVQSLTFAENRI